LKGGTLVLYDVSSSYVEGCCCPLAKGVYDRDGKKGKAQIVYGLLCAADGCPVAIEVFEGNTGDPGTVADQVAKLKQRFAINHVVLVGDRGMITQARIDEDLRSGRAGLDHRLARARAAGPGQRRRFANVRYYVVLVQSLIPHPQMYRKGETMSEGGSAVRAFNRPNRFRARLRIRVWSLGMRKPLHYKL
jgi:hypothetical protein